MLGDTRGQNETVAMVVIVGIAVVLGMFFGYTVFENVSNPGDDVPQMAFEYDYDRQTERLTVIHQQGDTVPGSEIFFVRRGEGGEPIEPRNWGSTDRVSAGDRIVLENVAEDDTVLVVWDRGPEERAFVIGEWSGPSA